jgi:hypothetical protein
VGTVLTGDVIPGLAGACSDGGVISLVGGVGDRFDVGVDS